MAPTSTTRYPLPKAYSPATERDHRSALRSATRGPASPPLRPRDPGTEADSIFPLSHELARSNDELQAKASVFRRGDRPSACSGVSVDFKRPPISGSDRVPRAAEGNGAALPNQDRFRARLVRCAGAAANRAESDRRPDSTTLRVFIRLAARANGDVVRVDGGLRWTQRVRDVAGEPLPPLPVSSVTRSEASTSSSPS